MSTIVIDAPEDLYEFEYLGLIGHGAFVVADDNSRWLAYDTEDGAMCIRPRHEDEPVKVGKTPFGPITLPVYKSLEDLPFPVTITTEN